MSQRRHGLAVAGLALLAGLLVAVVSTQVFPYHSPNHDEAVYLQQAAMLLKGQLFLDPPVPEAFRPWFFVDDGGQLYPKYSPVPAAMFALGMALGSPRITLVLVAAGVVALTAVLVSDLFDRQTGILAGLLLTGSPLFLVDASVFLPYIPTTLLNLAFAVAYLHADRTGSYRTAALAGVAIGIAFFARPFTALLFALPFVAHACWTLRTLDRAVAVRQGVIATLGVAGVSVTLVYNAVVTGDPLLFPYQAFAPQDGIGFGHREILGYSRQYTPALALRSNVEALWVLATKWVVAGALGSLAAAVGLVATLRRGITAREATLAGLFVTVPVGNLFFWGTLNALGALDRAGDGLIHFLGPYYHADLLVPTAAFAAVGLRLSWSRLRSLVERQSWTSGRHVVAALLVASTVFAGVGVGMAGAPLAENRALSDRYERAYQPFEEETLDDSLMFLPSPYGDWLNHPFQPLRNDPGYDSGTVYALSERQFAVVEQFPDRDIYRYTYNGEWAPTAGQTVDPHLQRVEYVRGETVRGTIRLGVPEYAESVSVRLASDNGSAYTTTDTVNGTVTLHLTLTGESARVDGEQFEPTTVSRSGRETLLLSAFVDYGTGAGFTYRFELPVDDENGTVQALTPYAEICRDATQCGGEAAYVPGTHIDGIAVETNLTAS